MHVYRIDVEAERDCKFEGCSGGKADIYGDSVHEINGRLWRLWGVLFVAVIKDKRRGFNSSTPHK